MSGVRLSGFTALLEGNAAKPEDPEPENLITPHSVFGP